MTSPPLPFSHNGDPSRRFVIFDMFETLVGLRDDITMYDILDHLHGMYLHHHDYAAVRHLYEEKVHELFDERAPQDLEVVFIEVLEHIFSGLGISEGQDLRGIERSVFQASEFVTEMKGAIDTLRFFKDNGYKTAVLSNSFFLESTLWSCLTGMGLSEHIDILVSSADILYRKPRTEAYDAVLRRLGAEAKDTFFIGNDPVNDYDGPMMHGMVPIHVCSKGERRGLHLDSIGKVPSLFNP